MAGVGLGGFFSGDPNPNPFTDILPHSGAIVGTNGEPITEPDFQDLSSFEDHDGYDPPGGNGILNPTSAATNPTQQGFGYSRLREEASHYGRSKLEELKLVEEDIRDLLLARKKLLRHLKTERDEIDKRLNVSDTVTEMLDDMFPDQLAKEIESGVLDE